MRKSTLNAALRRCRYAIAKDALIRVLCDTISEINDKYPSIDLTLRVEYERYQPIAGTYAEYQYNIYIGNAPYPDVYLRIYDRREKLICQVESAETELAADVTINK